MGIGITQEVFAIRQLEKVLISLGQSSVPQLGDILERYLHGGQKDRGCEAVT